MEIFPHIRREDEREEDEKAADDIVPERSQDAPFNVFWEEPERDYGDDVKVLVHGSPTMPGGNSVGPRKKEE